jgi:hypothetical protein
MMAPRAFAVQESGAKHRHKGDAAAVNAGQSFASAIAYMPM